MRQIPEGIINFLHAQNFVIVSSIDKNGFPHSSCKGIVRIDPQGVIYLVDVYRGVTCENIKNNPAVSLSVVDEHKFMGYCFKGKAKILPNNHMSQEIIERWESNITARLTQRLLKNLGQDKTQKQHPEAALPHPEHLIALEVEQIVDLAIHNFRKEI